jgi:hypothetical protein
MQAAKKMEKVEKVEKVDPRFLFYSQGKLEEQFSEQLRRNGILVDGDGSKRPQDFSLVVLDGSTLKPEELSRHASSLQAALENNRPVLLLKPTLEHKQVLAKSKIISHYIQAPSVALLIEPRRDKANQLRIGLSEQFPNTVGRTDCTAAQASKDGTVKKQPVSEALPDTSASTPVDLRPFMQRVKEVVTTLASGQPLQLDETEASPNSPPSSIPSGLYDVTPIIVYVPFTPSGSAQSGYTPPNGSFILQGLVTVGVYYDNTSYNTPVQWLLIEHSGMCDTNLTANDKSHLGWSLGSLEIDAPDISSSTLAYKESSPNNANNVTSYTSSSSFTVGLAGGTDGLSGNASYTIGSSETSSLTDWSIVQNHSNSWTFAQAVPYNGLDSGFPDGSVGMSGIASLPALSTAALDYTTQTVWCQIPAGQNSMSLTYTYTVGAWFIYEDNGGWIWHAYSWHSSMAWSLPLAINFGAAWPSSQ